MIITLFSVLAGIVFASSIGVIALTIADVLKARKEIHKRRVGV